MANERRPDDNPTPAVLLPIEQLRERCNTPGGVFAGVRASQGWAPGKCVTEREYRAAVDSFLKKAGA